MVFHWSLSDSKSPQVSRTLLSILAVLSNAFIRIVSTRLPTSKSSRPFNNPLVNVPKAPITIGTIVTFMFHSFFNSLARSRYLSFFSHSFSFILWSAGAAKSSLLQILFFFLFFFFVNFGLVIWPRLGYLCVLLLLLNRNSWNHIIMYTVSRIVSWSDKYLLMNTFWYLLTKKMK